MKALSLFLIGAPFLIGCSTSGLKSKDVDQITQEDFKPVKAIRYSKKMDKLLGVESKFTESLNDESMARVISFDGEFSSRTQLDELALYCHQKKFKQAYALVKEKSRKYIKNPIFWNHLGTCFLLEGQYRKALLFFNRSLSIKSNYVPALNNLGVMYLKLDDRDRAFVAFKRAVRVGEFKKTPRFNLALLYLKNGLYDETLSVLKPFHKKTTDIDVLNMKAVAYLMRGNLEETLKHFKKINSDFYEKAEYGINYAIALYAAGRRQESRRIFKDVEVSKDSKWYSYYLEVSRILEGK